MPLTSNSESFLNLDSLYGLIRFAGPEASEFLQRQLSCDLDQLRPGKVLPGAWLNPAGRVIATLDLIAEDAEILALVPRPLTEQVITGISRYLLNARLTISQADLHLLGVLDPTSADGWDWPGNRRILISNGPGLESAKDLDRWQRADIKESLVRLDEVSTAQYLPQMLGLESRGAISYDKGCFPGQEVVARTHYLGKIKRGLVALGADNPLARGAAVTDEQGQPVGTVIQVATGKSSGGICLAVTKVGLETPLTSSGMGLLTLENWLAEAPSNG